MTDLTTWHRWSPITVPGVGTVGFAKKGDKAAFVYRPFGIPVGGTMHLVDLRPAEMWSVRFEQKGFPAVDMTWSFENAGAHAFTVDVIVETKDKEWWDKTYQWVSMMPVWIKRDIRHALEALHEHFVHPEDEDVKAAS